jgi:hypothetical protein
MGIIVYLYIFILACQIFRNVVLEKDGEDQLDQSCEK